MTTHAQAPAASAASILHAVPHSMFAAGAWVDSSDLASIDVIDPATAETIRGPACLSSPTPRHLSVGPSRAGWAARAVTKGCICPGIARWSQRALSEESPLRYEVVDLAEVNLPFLDEPLKPALGGYTHEHTKAWSNLITGYRGFVFVFPQYN